MLREHVVHPVREERFHVHAVPTVHEALPLLCVFPPASARPTPSSPPRASTRPCSTCSPRTSARCARCTPHPLPPPCPTPPVVSPRPSNAESTRAATVHYPPPSPPLSAPYAHPSNYDQPRPLPGRASRAAALACGHHPSLHHCAPSTRASPALGLRASLDRARWPAPTRCGPSRSPGASAGRRARRSRPASPWRRRRAAAARRAG